MIWSLTTDTDDGINTSLHLSERNAFEALATYWFSGASSELEPSHKDEYASLLTALSLGTENASLWLEEYLQRTNSDSRVALRRHSLPA